MTEDTGVMIATTTETEERQVRALCLQLALDAAKGTGEKYSVQGLVRGAEILFAFVKDGKSPPDPQLKAVA